MIGNLTRTRVLTELALKGNFSERQRIQGGIVDFTDKSFWGSYLKKLPEVKQTPKTIVPEIIIESSSDLTIYNVFDEEPGDDAVKFVEKRTRDDDE